MLYRPISAHPSNGVSIDATTDNIFSTIVQGASSSVTHYKASFYDADTLEWEFDTQKSTLPEPLTAGKTLSFNVPSSSGLQNNRSYYWTLRLYQQTPDMFVTNSVVQDGSTASSIVIREHYNIKEEMYISIGGQQKQINKIVVDTEKHTSTLTLSSSFPSPPAKDSAAKIYSNFVDSVQFGFSTNKTPILTITNAPTKLSSRSYQFLMSYSQDENVPMKWHQFILETESGQILKDTGRIFNADLTFEFDGFISGARYTICGVAETVNGVTVSSPKYTFSVYYPSPNIDLPPTVSVDYDDHAIKIEWVPDSFSEGILSPAGSFHYEQDYPFSGAVSLSVDEGFIKYDSISGHDLDLSEEFGVLSDITISNNTVGNIISLESDNGRYYKLVSESGSLLSNRDGLKNKLVSLYQYEKSGQQQSPVSEPNTAYFCYRAEVCNKSLYCVKSLPFTKRYKVAMLNDKIKLSEVL